MSNTHYLRDRAKACRALALEVGDADTARDLFALANLYDEQAASRVRDERPVDAAPLDPELLRGGAETLLYCHDRAADFHAAAACARRPEDAASFRELARLFDRRAETVLPSL
ncbi:hypothetical protein [Sphingomonas lenta]|uniref:Uncharacterized protein n=1 Tax=Sphingomonas lenta TaxID=1141887 RepID=A0A2A2SF97_9SPHN|nr:hypothetical protein [Sphingomonas lenta]PAX07908.1 hypothetical protein CKY28_09870 [Sphingomonas lenta]